MKVWRRKRWDGENAEAFRRFEGDEEKLKVGIRDTLSALRESAGDPNGGRWEALNMAVIDLEQVWGARVERETVSKFEPSEFSTVFYFWKKEFSSVF